MKIFDDAVVHSKKKKALQKPIEIVDESNVVFVKDNGISSKMVAADEAKPQPYSALEEEKQEKELLAQNFPIEDKQPEPEKKQETQEVKAVPGEVPEQTLDVVAEPLGHSNPLVFADLLLNIADAVSKTQLNAAFLS